MTHKRNTGGLRDHAQRKSQAAFERVREAIEVLRKDSQPIDFQSVAEKAQVSVAYLYKYPDLKKWIEQHRAQSQLKLFQEGELQVKAPDQTCPRVAQENQALRMQNKHLRKQNRELKEKLTALEVLEQEVNVLKKQKQSLLQEITGLKAAKP